MSKSPERLQHLLPSGGDGLHFGGRIWRKLFQNHVENLHKYYKSVRMQIKTFQEKDLLHNEEQTLTEEELLLICSDRMSENIFHGFSVRKLEIC